MNFENPAFFLPMRGPVEKRHHQNTVETALEEADSFEDRRLSDLLPSDMVRQIGFDPDALLFKPGAFAIPRRMTDPVQSVFGSDPGFARRGSAIFIPPAQKVVNCFFVELKDRIVHAFSTFVITLRSENDGVVVKDGLYLRFGRITEEIPGAPTVQSASLQIVARDKDFMLSEYINFQGELAANLARTFIVKAQCPVRFVSIEPVSFRGRTLFRMKVSNANAPNLEEVVRLLIQAFSVAVEVFD
jgi:hypothetical protein